MEILQWGFFPAGQRSATSRLVEDPKRMYIYIYIYIHYYRKHERETRAVCIYADVEGRYHRARMSIGITSRGDILLSVLARVYRFAFESRRLKGYKRTDPCVSPLFPLIFLHENPQSVRAIPSLSLSFSVDQHVRIESKHSLLPKKR